MKPLTIGELRKAIEGYSDNTHVLIAQTPEGALSDWFNVSNEFGLPNDENGSEYWAFTLFPVDTYDARQF